MTSTPWAWAEKIAEQITYQRPPPPGPPRTTNFVPASGNWRFGVHPAHPIFIVEAVFPDGAGRPDTFTTITRHIDLMRIDGFGEGPVYELLCRKVWEAITEIETHERLEHLKIGGTQMWDPHPNPDPGAAAWSLSQAGPLATLESRT